ncbi:hypothetical protein ES703_58791 [subsurface metagenome]
MTAGAPNQTCLFKRYGDTLGWPAVPDDSGSGQSRAYVNQDNMCYIFVPTDEHGRVQWGHSVANTWDVYLLGYIKNVTYHNIPVYSGLPLDKMLGLYQTLDLPVTSRVLAFLKNHSNGLGPDIGLRQTGLTALFPHDGGQGFQCAGSWTGYMAQLTNRYGQLDFFSSMPIGISPIYLQLTIP